MNDYLYLLQNRWAAAGVGTALGLIFGSFANVCVHRIPEGRSVVRPGSACPGCGNPIGWYDNIPVLSWLMLGGRCRSCKVSIPARYPALEAASGLVLGLLAFQHGLSARWAGLSFLAVSILVLVPIDMKHGILPDRITLPGIAVGLALSLVPGEPTPVRSLAGAASGALVPLLVRALYMAWSRIRAGRGAEPEPVASVEPAEREPAPEQDEDLESMRREGMGLGDVKMLAMVGAFLGPAGALLTMLLGSVLGTLYVVPTVLAGRREMKSPIPFGPFLGAAALLALFGGEELIAWYLRRLS